VDNFLALSFISHHVSFKDSNALSVSSSILAPSIFHSLFFRFSRAEDFSISHFIFVYDCLAVSKTLFLPVSKKFLIVDKLGSHSRYFFLKSTNSDLVVSIGSSKNSFSSHSGRESRFILAFKSSTDLIVIFSSGEPLNISDDMLGFGSMVLILVLI